MNKKTPNHKERGVTYIMIILAIIFLLTISIIVIGITRKGQEKSQIGESATVALETSNKETLPVPVIEVLTEHSACSTDEDPWHNNESVEVKIEKTKDIDNKEYQVMYAIMEKEADSQKENIEYEELTENSKTISITREGKTEIIAYTVNREGKKSEEVRQLVQIDRTAPTVGGIDYSEEDGEVLMVTRGVEDNNNGSGIAEYMYFKDNNIKPKDIIAYNKVGTCERPEVARISVAKGECLAQVAITDKAGNIATVAATNKSPSGTYTFTYSPAAPYTRTCLHINDYYAGNSWVSGNNFCCLWFADQFELHNGYVRFHWRTAYGMEVRN